MYAAQGLAAFLPLLQIRENLNEYESTSLAIVTCALSLGAVVYATEYPDPFPKHFGYHEIWHFLITLAHIAAVNANMSVISRELSTE